MPGQKTGMAAKSKAARAATKEGRHYPTNNASRRAQPFGFWVLGFGIKLEHSPM